MRLGNILVTSTLLLATLAACEDRARGEIEIPPELAAKATVTADQAKATALARVPGGEIRSGGLEEEDGMLVYSFDIEVEGRSGAQEILVDARSGQVVSETHESDAQEAAEARGADEGGGGH